MFRPSFHCKIESEYTNKVGAPSYIPCSFLFFGKREPNVLNAACTSVITDCLGKISHFSTGLEAETLTFYIDDPDDFTGSFMKAGTKTVYSHHLG
jgi:hypothetical protein